MSRAGIGTSAPPDTTPGRDPVPAFPQNQRRSLVTPLKNQSGQPAKCQGIQSKRAFLRLVSSNPRGTLTCSSGHKDSPRAVSGGEAEDGVHECDRHHRRDVGEGVDRRGYVRYQVASESGQAVANRCELGQEEHQSGERPGSDCHGTIELTPDAALTIRSSPGYGGGCGNCSFLRQDMKFEARPGG